MSTLAEMVVRIGADATRLKAGLAMAGRDVQGFQARTRAAGDAMTSFGRSSMKGGLLLGVGLGAAVKTGIDFDHTMSTVKAATGATAKEFGVLRSSALKYGAASQFSSRQVAEAMVEMGKAGFKTKETLAALPGVLSAAAASGESMATVSNIMVNTLTGFGLGAGNAVKISDALAYSANETTASISDFGEALKYVAPVAKSAGVSFDETNGALVALAKVGIQGSMAGTNLRGVLQSMVAPNKRVSEAMKTMHLSFRDARGEMLPLATNIDTLKKALAGMDKSKADQFLARMFGRENISAAQAFLDIGGAGLRKFADESEHSRGAAAKFAATLRDNLSGDLENFTGSVETAAIHMSDALTPSLRSIVGRLTELANAFSKLDPAMQATIAKTVALSAVFLVTMGVLGVFGGAVLRGISMMAPLAAGIALVGRAIQVMALQAAIAAPALEGIGLAIAASNPVLLGVVAVAATAGAAYLLLKSDADQTAVSHQKLADAVQSAKNAIDNIKPDQLGMREAKLGVDQAAASVSSLRLQLKSSTLSAAGHRDLTLQLRGALLQQDRATMNLATTTHKFKGTVEGAQKAVVTQKNQLKDLRAEHDRLRGKLAQALPGKDGVLGQASAYKELNQKLKENEKKQADVQASLGTSLAKVKSLGGAGTTSGKALNNLWKSLTGALKPVEMKPINSTKFVSGIDVMVMHATNMRTPMQAGANSAGYSVGTGVASGIDASAGSAFAAADRLAEGVVARMMRAHDSASPSKRFAREVGQPIPEGIAVGIMSKKKVAVDASAALAQAVMGGAVNAITKNGIGATQAAANAAQRVVDVVQAKADAAARRLAMIDARAAVRAAAKTKDKGDNVTAKRSVADAALAIRMAKLQAVATAAQKKVDALSASVANFQQVDGMAAAAYGLAVSLNGGTASLAMQQGRIKELTKEYASLAAFLQANASKLGADARSQILGQLQSLSDEMNTIRDAIAEQAAAEVNKTITSLGQNHGLADAQYALSVALSGGSASMQQQTQHLAALQAQYASIQNLINNTPNMTIDQLTTLTQNLSSVAGEINNIADALRMAGKPTNDLANAQYALAVALNGGVATAAMQAQHLAALKAQYASLYSFLQTTAGLTADEQAGILGQLTSIQNDINGLNNDIYGSATGPGAGGETVTATVGSDGIARVTVNQNFIGPNVDHFSASRNALFAYQTAGLAPAP